GRSASPCPECGTTRPSNGSTDRDSLQSRPVNAPTAPTLIFYPVGAAQRSRHGSNRLPASASTPPAKIGVLSSPPHDDIRERRRIRCVYCRQRSTTICGSDWNLLTASAIKVTLRLLSACE